MTTIDILFCIAFLSAAIYAIIFRIKSVKKSFITYKATGNKAILYTELIWVMVTLAAVVVFVYQSKILKFITK